MTELSTRVAAATNDVPPTAVTDEQREVTRCSLHHCDLPKLADYGIVEWTPDDETVALVTVAESTTTAVNEP